MDRDIKANDGKVMPQKQDRAEEQRPAPNAQAWTTLRQRSSLSLFV